MNLRLTDKQGRRARYEQNKTKQQQNRRYTFETHAFPVPPFYSPEVLQFRIVLIMTVGGILPDFSGHCRETLQRLTHTPGLRVQPLGSGRFFVAGSLKC